MEFPRQESANNTQLDSPSLAARKLIIIPHACKNQTNYTNFNGSLRSRWPLHNISNGPAPLPH